MEEKTSGRRFMLLAIKEAEKNLRLMTGGPFGACIIRKGRVLAVARNTVLAGDPTSHAEINAIRMAARKLKSYDLSGCTLYSTTEPCPMCFSAIHWAKIDCLIYGTGISDVKKRGFNELTVSNRLLKKMGKSPVKIVAGFARAECLGLLRKWDDLPRKITY
jgi:guanine deaminase